MEKVLNKANGHIVQADWNEQDNKSFSYICNKPEIPTVAPLNLTYTNGGGYPTAALEQFTELIQYNEELSKRAVTVKDIYDLLTHFDLNFEAMQSAMSNSQGNFNINGCLGVLPIPYSVDLSSSDWSDLPVYYTAPTTTSIAARHEDGNLTISQNPQKSDDAASKAYVDKLNKQIIYRPYLEKTFKLSDCTYQIVGSGSLIWFLMCSLPDFQFDVSTRTMISVSNVPAAPYFTGGTHDFLNIISDGAKNIYTPLLSSTDSGYVNHGMVTTEEGMVYFQLGETMGGTLTTDNLEAFLAHYADMEFTIMYTDPVEDEPRDYQSIKLYSNSILDYNAPTDTINIADLVSCEGHIDEWTIHFITASNTSPFVTMPLQINGNYVSWVNGEPEFIGATRYTVTFRRIGEIIYATCVNLDSRGGEN